MPVSERLFKLGIFVVCLSVVSLFIGGCGTAGANVGQSTTNPPQTWTISGTLSPASSSAGATVALSGTASASVTADVNGNYSFANLSNGTYTVTPTKSRISFLPASQNVTINGGSQSTINFNASGAAGPTLQSITINGGGTSIAKGTTAQFTATATFSDGSTQDLTNSVTWSSSNTSVATIAAVGIVAGVNAGTSTISATQNGVTSNSLF